MELLSSLGTYFPFFRGEGGRVGAFPNVVAVEKFLKLLETVILPCFFACTRIFFIFSVFGRIGICRVVFFLYFSLRFFRFDNIHHVTLGWLTCQEP